MIVEDAVDRVEQFHYQSMVALAGEEKARRREQREKIHHFRARGTCKTQLIWCHITDDAQ